MKIKVNDYREGSHWSTFFEMLSKGDWRPIWLIIGVPAEIVSRPEPVINVARQYAKTLSSEKPGEYSGETNLEKTFESLRSAVDFKVNTAFTTIGESYGEEAVSVLSDLAIRAFLHEKGKYCGIWFNLFSGFYEIDNPLTKYLDEFAQDRLDEIVKSEMSVYEQNWETIKTKLKQLSEREFAYTSMGNVVERNCGISIWHEINLSMEKENKEKLYQWGYDNVDYLTTKREWKKLKADCFSF